MTSGSDSTPLDASTAEYANPPTVLVSLTHEFRRQDAELIEVEPTAGLADGISACVAAVEELRIEKHEVHVGSYRLSGTLSLSLHNPHKRYFLRAALSVLSVDERKSVEIVDYRGLAYDEAAERLACDSRSASETRSRSA